ncbi:MAG: methyl-accepting chemotaxis protein [Holophaga sp.]|nr:methyl-accepting chemotaxis protein [Holophaga sp.]
MTWLRNLSLGKKFGLLVGIQVLVLLAGGLLVWIRFEQVQGVLSQVRTASRRAQLTATLANAMNTLRTSQVEMIAAPHSEAYLQKRGATTEAFSRKLEEDIQTVQGDASWTPESRRQLDEAIGTLRGYLGKFPAVFKQAKAGKADGDPALMDANVGEARAAREDLEKIQALVQGEENEQTKRADVMADQTQIMVIVGALLSIAVAVLIARIVLSQVASSAHELHIAMDRLADGDLTVEAKVETTDELGQIGAALNRSVHSLRATLTSVKQVSEQVASGATELSATAEELSATTSSIATGTGEASASAERMAAAAVQLAASIHAVAGNVHVAETKSGGALEQTHEGVDAGRNTNMAMAEIQEAVSSIVRAVQVVTEIANQTNLLSLNAAIEAAKAGELGKGFAVVAEEVRKLAERSGQAAHEIGDLADRCTVSIGRGSETVKVSDGVLNAIQTAITEVASRIGQIGAASEEQASTGEDVGRQVHLAAEAAASTAQATREQALTVEEVSRTAHDLARAAEMLQTTVLQFKV